MNVDAKLVVCKRKYRNELFEITTYSECFKLYYINIFFFQHILRWYTAFIQKYLVYEHAVLCVIRKESYDYFQKLVFDVNGQTNNNTSILM